MAEPFGREVRLGDTRVLQDVQPRGFVLGRLHRHVWLRGDGLLPISAFRIPAR